MNLTILLTSLQRSRLLFRNILISCLTLSGSFAYAGLIAFANKETQTSVAGKVTTTLLLSTAKLTVVDKCPKMLTEIAAHDTGKARVNLAPSKGSLQTLELPVGTYSYDVNRDDRICKLIVKVIGKVSQFSANWPAMIYRLGSHTTQSGRSVVLEVIDSVGRIG